MSNHKPNGDFAKGNTAAKKDITRATTKEIVKGEMRYATELVCRMSVKDLKKRDLDNETLLTHVMIKQALKGNFQPLQWMVEMTMGKPKQQQELDVSKNAKQVIELAYSRKK